MHFSIIIFDYYLQMLESGVSKNEAEDKTHSFMLRFRNEMKRDEYLIVFEMITRFANI